MIIEISKLEGAALDWAVAQVDSMCLGLDWKQTAVVLTWVGFGVIDSFQTPCAFLSNGVCMSEKMRMRRRGVDPYSPSTDWSQGGRLIESMRVTVEFAMAGKGLWHAYVLSDEENAGFYGSTPLTAACRAIVAAASGASKIEVPDKIMGALS